MQFFQITNGASPVVENRTPTLLKSGHYQIIHVADHDFMKPRKLMVPYTISGNRLTINIRGIRGERGRVEFDRRFGRSPKTNFELTAADLFANGIDRLALTLNDTFYGRIFYVSDSRGMSVEFWPDIESARLGYLESKREKGY